MKEDQEFWIALVVYGGIISLGLVISIALVMVGLAIKKGINKKSVIKELFNEKQRKNGQGGSRGHY